MDLPLGSDCTECDHSFDLVSNDLSLGPSRVLEGHGLVAIDDRPLATRQFLGLINEPLLRARVIGAEPAPNLNTRNVAVERAVDFFYRTTVNANKLRAASTNHTCFDFQQMLTHFAAGRFSITL